MLAGDLIKSALGRAGGASDFDIDTPVTLADFDQGGTDPGNIAAFLALDIPFDVEPTTGLIFPAEVDLG